MTEEQDYYYVWTPLLAGKLLDQFPNEIVTDEKGEPILFARANDSGKDWYAWAFRNAEEVRQFVHAEYVQKGWPEAERNMRKFLSAVKGSKHGTRD